MIEVNSEIQNAYNNSTIQLDKIIVDNQEYLIKAEYYDDAYYEGNIFGTAIAKAIDFEIENTIDLESKEFEYYSGIKINNEINWIYIGNFITLTIEPNDTQGINKVTAFDYMLKASTTYKTKLNYTGEKITLLDVVEEVCENCGLELATKDFANADFIVDSNQFSLESLHIQVLQAIAQISGTFAKIKSDNKLYFINPNKNMEIRKIFNLNTYKDAEIKRNTHPINVVSLGMSGVEGENITVTDDESIAKIGENALIINDNPFAYTQQKREQLITALFNAVKGFQYTAYTINTQGIPYLETGDKIQLLDMEGNVFDSYIFRFNNKSPNGLESSIEAPSIIKATVNYKVTLDSIQIARMAEFRVNKAELTIQSLIRQVGDRTNKETSITEDIDSIEAYVKNNIDITNEKTGTDKIILENSMNGTLLSLHIYGNNTVFASLLPNDDLLPSDDLLPYGEESLIKVTRQELDNEGKITSEESEIIDLGVKLALRQKDGVYDEYVLENGKSKVIRRIGVLDDQTTFIRETPIIEDLGTLEIKTARGNTIIEILNYTANMMADYVVINQYTETFSTTVDVMAMIKILEQNIMLEVNKKVNDDNIIASINLAVKGKQGIIDLIGNIVRITADYFKLDENGKITCTAGEIGGWNINSNSLSKEKEQNIQYVRGDIQECELLADLEEAKKWDSKYISSINADSYRKFDFDGDGEITSSDVNTLIDLVGGSERPILTNGKTQINSNDIFSTMTFENDTMSAKTKIGTLGIDSNVVAFKLIFADRLFLSKGIILPIGDGLRQVIPVVSYTNDHNYQFNIENIGDLNFLRTFVDVSDMGHIPIIPVDYKGIQTPIANEKINILTDKGSYMEVQTGTNTYIVQYATSDEKIKKNIKETEIESSLELLSKIDYYSFDLKSNNRHQKIGFKANKLHELEPSLAIPIEQPNGEVIYNYDINTIIPLLGKGLKEAYQEIKNLKREIENLKKGKM